MVARTTTGVWLSGVMVGALVTAPIGAQAPVNADNAAPIPTSQARPARVQGTLNSAIDHYRRSDFEVAATLFQQAQLGQDDLTPAQRRDLETVMALNEKALQARREGQAQLHDAEQAIHAGRIQDAATMLKSVSANQFLPAADKLRAQQLAEMVRPVMATKSPTATATGAASVELARSKLTQARTLLSKGNYDAAEALAREAEHLGAVYTLGEDSPSKVLNDINKMRNDPNALLKAARLALKNGELDRAEKLAHDSENVGSAWRRPFQILASDSPQKVLKDVQAARLKLAATPINPKTGPGTSKVKETIVGKPMVNPNTDKARELLKLARVALKDGDYNHARKLAEQAKVLKPELNWWEETPEKILTEVQRAEAAKQPATAKASTTAVTATAPAAKTSEESKNANPRAQLKKARELYQTGKLDEAKELALKANASNAHWGLFEDSPEKLNRDIDRALAKRDHEESFKVLAEARKHFEQGDLSNAESMAYRAEKMHGAYSIWEMGDQPKKLLAEIETARAKNHKVNVPTLPESVVKSKPAPKPEPVVSAVKKDTAFTEVSPRPTGVSASTVAMAPPTPVTAPAETVSVNVPATLPVVDTREQQARKMLSDARTCLRSGDTAQALRLATEVEMLGVRLDKPGDDSPAAIKRDCEVAVNGSRPINPFTDASNKLRAQEMLAQAKRMQTEGRLVEARQKAMEAQKLSVVFGANEERPEPMLQQLTLQCNDRIKRLLQQAQEHASRTGIDPTAQFKAENELKTARQLSTDFGLDTRAIDDRLRDLTNRTEVVQLQVQESTRLPAQPIAPSGAQTPGMTLLEKARLELRRGETGTARRLTEEAFNGPYGVQTEAEVLLRSIDAEEFGQRVIIAKRNFDSAVQAYQNRDYARAAGLFRTIDMSLLDQEKQARYRELMQTPAMQPASVTLASAKSPVSSLPGTARATDGRSAAAAPLEDSLMQRTKAMQKVKFMQMRDKGLVAQQEATSRFGAQDTDRALEILQNYLGELREAQLDAEQTALLQRPIDAKLQTFKMLKAQTDFEKMLKNQGTAVADMRSRQALAEENKRKQITELMNQYKTLYKEAKYQEAEAFAMRAHELDPDDPSLGAAVFQAKIQKNSQEAKTAKDSRADFFVHELNEVETYPDGLTGQDPIRINKNSMERSKMRTSYRNGLSSTLRDEKEKEIALKLLRPVDMDFRDTPLRQVLDDLQAKTGINIALDLPALADEGISLDKPITQTLNQISLKSALNVVLHQARLTHVIEDQVLKVTTESHARGKLELKSHPVADLVVPVDNYAVPNSGNLTRILEKQHDSNVTRTGGGMQGISTLTAGLPLGGNMSSINQPGNPGTITSATPEAQITKSAPGQTIENVLIRLITNSIAPSSWDDVGGPGHIEYYPLGMALVINQTPDIQEQIAELLAALRRLQDLEVAVEVRLISLSESFYERIGVDFNINILSGSSNTPAAAQLVTQNFAAPFQINSFTPKNFVSGLSTAGSTSGNNASFTTDLDVPITGSSFARGVPPFGGYAPGTPAGGIQLGLAFLSDIQVFMFMEAAQGDRRFNLMQAPKLTMFNGQTATISIQDQQFFVTNIQVPVANGQVTFVPQNQPFPLGVQLTVQPVVTADRRFVRMSLSPSLTNLASATVPLFPITSFITPVFEGGAQGQPVPFTQFLQQPSFNTVTLQTTVSVPDGGTVLLGGLKLLNEGRNEFGPPVLSKIPYINRLFKNVGYGRDTSSLLIMVTPRIIINEEEEIRQTGSAPVAPGQ